MVRKHDLASAALSEACDGLIYLPILPVLVLFTTFQGAWLPQLNIFPLHVLSSPRGT